MNTGGSAFPGTEVVGSCDGVGSKDGIWHNPGMTLRDYFAAKAMQTMFEFCVEHEDLGFEELAERSYVMADVMLKAREK